ncbi:NACHT domain-containing protein (plasmid) [Streptomyces sp. GDS52]|uniref:NACHT domain-containing protein n=1 Tax=Streptomyces sp. GDS52 TaxID=3406419 RepID=UPI003FD085A0
MGFVAGDQLVWSRWWGPEQIETQLFGGVLPDPRDYDARFFNGHLKELKDFAACRALVLLGEPGAGKSFELEKEIQRRTSSGERVEPILLREFSTPSEVREAIRDAVAGWHETGSPGDLTLAFDGFDEPLFAIGNLADVLERELARLDPERLRVLITSRRSVWRGRLEAAFAQWWPNSSSATLLLAPLTERDIRQAAATELTDPDGFVTSLKTADVQLLAASPMTLRLLLAAYVKGNMPSQRSHIYALGVTGLAAEANTDRADRGREGPPLTQRLSAAQQLAAVSLLSGRTQVTRRSQPLQEEGALSLDEVDDSAAALDALEAVFDSALLTDGRAGRTWTHRSVQEFLVARRCEDLALASVQHLLADPLHPARVLPQLAGVAAWLAALRADVVEWLAAAEPEVLVQADLRGLPEPQRARVAGAVVAKLSVAPVPGIRSGYAGLLHAGLGAQLAPLLRAGGPAWQQQEAALIIQATGLRKLDAQLMELLEGISTDRGREGYDERIRAAEWATRALQGTQDSQILDRAMRLAADAERPWPLRAELLAVLWPEHVDMSWLLAVVAEPDRAPHSSMGRRVVAMLARQSRAGRCSIEDLEAWAAPLTSGAHANPMVRRMLGRTAWTAVQTSAVGSSAWRAGTRLLDAQWAANHSLQGVSAQEITALERDRRRQLVWDLVYRAGNGHAVAARMRDVGMLRVEDVEWWLDDLRRVEAERSGSAPAFFALYALADAVDEEEAARVVAAAEAAAPRWEALSARFAPAARAERARQRQVSVQCGGRWSAEGALGETDFAALMRALHHEVGVSARARPVPAWPALTKAQQQTVAERALSFLCTGPDAADEVGADLITNACRVIEAFDRTLLDRVPVEHWLRWLPGLWEVPGGFALLSSALKRAGAYDEDATVGFLTQVLTSDVAAVAFHQRHMRLPQLSAQALDRLRADRPSGQALAALLDIAAAALPAETAQTALGLLQRSAAVCAANTGDASVDRDTAVASGACLAACPMTPPVFDGLIEIFEDDVQLARDIIGQAHRNGNNAWSALTPSQRGRLYLWAHRALPRQLVAPGGVVRSSPVDEFASTIAGPLLSQPSLDHAAVLDGLAAQTGSVWLHADAVQMRDTVRAQAWRPPTVAEVREVLTAPSRRIIGSREQLAAVIAEALGDIADALRTDRALRAQLWHRQRRDNDWVGYVPAEEREVSTWLARELERRLRERAALLREVEINPRLAKTDGDIPDLLALAHTSGDQALSVPGEVKCSWHRQVVTAIRDQLGQRYLQGPHGTTGVYVAVYFGGSAWDTGDSRRAQSIRRSLDRLRQELDHHAADLAGQGITAHVCVLDASLEADALPRKSPG